MIVLDITELSAEDRQRVLWALPANEMAATLKKLMADNRQCEIGVRIDALTIAALRGLPPYPRWSEKQAENK